MAQQTVFVPEIGEVILSKRRGATQLRLSINAAGKVRVGMPYWTPYQAGIAFARSKTEWIQKHLATQSKQSLHRGDLIGKAHRLNYQYNPSAHQISAKITKSQITIITAFSFNDKRVQDKLLLACERALKDEAEHLLLQRLKYLASKYQFDYRDVRIRKLTARWGSCSSDGTITLSYYLMQLPWNLIDYVLLHELMHTRHMHHGKSFWSDFKKILPNVRALQKEIRPYKPLIQAFHIIPAK